MNAEQKIITDRLNMMCEYFANASRTNALYIPEFEAATLINSILNKSEVYTKEDMARIRKILNNVNSSKHKNDSHWYDYTLHLNYFFYHYD